MWSISGVKERAKRILYGNYWSAFLVSLLLVITGGNHNGGSSSRFHVSEREFFLNNRFTAIIVTLAVVFILLRLIIGFVVEVGGRKYFIELTRGKSNISYLGFGFSKGRYSNIFVTMLMRSLFLFFWFLLLIIPGIIKTYAYRFVPFILAENPKMHYSRAIEISNSMTMGEKMDMFIFDLSFIGWYILGLLALGLGVFFVQPYYDASLAELYMELRTKAINNGIVSRNELEEELVH